MKVATPSITEPAAGYAPPEEGRPLRGYLLLSLIFQALVAAAVVGLRRAGRRPPERIGGYDLLLVGAATHKLARLVTKDKVTSFIRAPFTEYEEPGGPAEVEEKPRGSGLRYAIGELLVCPYCLGLWVATAFGFGLVAAPRQTRLAAFILSALGISDFLQIAYKAAEDKGL